MAVATPAGSTSENILRHVTALARFEFEPDRGNEGTKVIMVEWQDADTTRSTSGSWHVSWPGKKSEFPADDKPSEEVHRVYFLLQPGVSIPPTIVISYHSRKLNGQEESMPLTVSVHPLPAIFTPELGATAKASGRKGVLHTIWAKKRLQALEKEIQQEEEHNLEGISLEMAIAEKSWIENTFGLQASSDADTTTALQTLASDSTNTVGASGQTSGSPTIRHLGEKLKGLGLDTNGPDVAVARNFTMAAKANPLSPAASDVAESSFSLFHDRQQDQSRAVYPSLSSASPTTSSMIPPATNEPPARKVVAQLPPDHIRQQQMQASIHSLDFLSQPHSRQSQATPSPLLQPLTQTLQQGLPGQEDDLASIQFTSFRQAGAYAQPPSPPGAATEEDLFAVALSPTSPDMPKSPFSFSNSDIAAPLTGRVFE